MERRQKEKWSNLFCIFTAHENNRTEFCFVFSNQKKSFHFVSSSLLLKERGIKQSTLEWEEAKERAACLWRMGEFRENNDSYKLVRKNSPTLPKGISLVGKRNRLANINKTKLCRTRMMIPWELVIHLLLSRSATMDV